MWFSILARHGSCVELFINGGVQLVASVCLSICQEVELSCSPLGATIWLVDWLASCVGLVTKRLWSIAWECAIMAMSVGGE